MEKLFIIQKLASILRTDVHVLADYDAALSRTTGKSGVIERLLEKNEELIRKSLDALGLWREAGAEEVYDALISCVDAEEHAILEALNFDVDHNVNLLYEAIFRKALTLLGYPKGFFLKKEKAEWLLRQNPPTKIMDMLGYKSADDLLANENLYEVFSALRFIQGNQWLNEVFFKSYTEFLPEDFEEREVEMIVMPERWLEKTRTFTKNKHHNLSHLKEIGVIFAMPPVRLVSGDLLRDLSLLAHYRREVLFYSNIFTEYAKTPSNFSERVIKALRGDVLEERLPISGATSFQIYLIQRYLMKDDPNDWRLFQPHINPEAEHWRMATNDIVQFGKLIGVDLSFWQDLDWVADFFKSATGEDIIVSFNLIDTIMSLVDVQNMVKYKYHNHEALWNELFSQYYGYQQMTRLMEENLDKGYIQL